LDLQNILLKHNLPIATRGPLLKINKFSVQNSRLINKHNWINFSFYSWNAFFRGFMILSHFRSKTIARKFRKFGVNSVKSTSRCRLNSRWGRIVKSRDHKLLRWRHLHLVQYLHFQFCSLGNKIQGRFEMSNLIHQGVHYSNHSAH